MWVCFLSSGCRTPLGRGRAWLRLALMQKKLSDYMKTIINRKDLLRCVGRVPPFLHWPLTVNDATFVYAANSMSQTRWWWRRREPSSRGCSSGWTSSMPICVWRERTWTLRCFDFYQRCSYCIKTARIFWRLVSLLLHCRSVWLIFPCTSKMGDTAVRVQRGECCFPPHPF